MQKQSWCDLQLNFYLVHRNPNSGSFGQRFSSSLTVFDLKVLYVTGSLKWSKSARTKTILNPYLGHQTLQTAETKAKSCKSLTAISVSYFDNKMVFYQWSHMNTKTYIIHCSLGSWESLKSKREEASNRAHSSWKSRTPR